MDMHRLYIMGNSSCKLKDIGNKVLPLLQDISQSTQEAPDNLPVERFCLASPDGPIVEQQVLADITNYFDPEAIPINQAVSCP